MPIGLPAGLSTRHRNGNAAGCGDCVEVDTKRFPDKAPLQQFLRWSVSDLSASIEENHPRRVSDRQSHVVHNGDNSPTCMRARCKRVHHVDLSRRVKEGCGLISYEGTGRR